MPMGYELLSQGHDYLLSRVDSTRLDNLGQGTEQIKQN